eukprot:TRINITY_DN5180_c0_g1_i1.p1 TRINITY_DN5180_c0_g1~~TRINITY_DN5180_c0_g1_i1.p1  ORF type:complete len:124 (-),score=34.29 TRINITY_DN5180_c0_g1_i1:90-461(-)
MNAPDRFELFELPEGVKKVAYVKDTKVQNAGSFLIQKEDHTLGNVIRMQLHRDPTVKFAGYKMPHPLDHSIIIKIQCTATSSPHAGLSTALTDLLYEFSVIEDKFKSEVMRKQVGARSNTEYL